MFNFDFSRNRDRKLRNRQRKVRRSTFRSEIARTLHMEPLENRLLLTANLFIDYGDNFPGGILSTTQGAFRDVAGTSGAHNPILGTELVQNNGFNAAGGLNIVAQSYTAQQRADALAVVQRAYAGLDINVIELTTTDQMTPDGRMVKGAANMGDVVTTLRGGNAAWKDAYVFVATFIADPGGANQVTYGGSGGGLSPGNNGFGETTDLNSASNLHDDVAVVYSVTGSFPNNTINNIAHEAGHNFGLRHGITNPITTNNSNAVTPAAVNLLHEADIMSYRNTNTTTSSVAFTRYPVIRGDGNSPGSGVLGSYDDLASRQGFSTNYDQLANDANVGAKPNVTFVSGTGAHDRITLTRNGANVDVSVEAFEDSAFATSIEVPGAGVGLNGASYNYSFPVNGNTILIQAGGSDDEIIINGDLGMNVLLDGMRGTDDLTVTAPNAIHTPNGAPTTSVDIGVMDYGGVVTMGSHTITYNNYELGSTFGITNLSITAQLVGGNLILNEGGGNTDDEITIAFDGANYIVSLAGGALFGAPGIAGDGTDTLTIPAASITGQITLNTQGGSDLLTVDHSQGLIPRPIVYDAGESGGDNDELEIVGYNV
ncbi:MAG: hypothetical protein KDA71_16900, partial [Planctomycetales bacterium]|nr:hypothetical protein [Planctomycetales bacterium]